ncbi:YceD family protein [Neisseria musculi]|uniref:YceD family protein n=1 Tax=Neisseria musculi TaxID=1815583 RepID=UPI00164AF27F|nr:YceD family protein [Neisseria musculi]QNT60206.1 hypothetical protein H7A79_2504 [Neisseria musculi]
MSDLNLIDPAAFAAEKQSLQGRFLLSRLDERVWSHEYFADKQAEVWFALKGGQDRFWRLFLDLTVTGSVPLVCQRCMQPMPFDFNEAGRIVLFDSEAGLDEAMLSDEDLEGMVAEETLDVRTLVEDQILMALPFSPRHENCAHAVAGEVNRDKPNPFAVLAGLKSSR